MIENTSLELVRQNQPLSGRLLVAGKEWRLAPSNFNQRRLYLDGGDIPHIKCPDEIERLGALPIEELWIHRSELREVDGLPALVERLKTGTVGNFLKAFFKASASCQLQDVSYLALCQLTSTPC